MAYELNKMSMYGIREKILEYKYKLETAENGEKLKVETILEMLSLMLTKKQLFVQFHQMTGIWWNKYGQKYRKKIHS